MTLYLGNFFGKEYTAPGGSATEWVAWGRGLGSGMESVPSGRYVVSGSFIGPVVHQPPCECLTLPSPLLGIDSDGAVVNTDHLW